MIKKVSSKKMDKKQQTRKKQTEFGGFEAAAGSFFGQRKRRYRSQKPPNQGPKTDPPNLLTSQLKGSSGLPRSLALSSNCACGAIKMTYLSWRLGDRFQNVIDGRN